MSMADTVNIRFRHTQGDIGPLDFPASSTVQCVRKCLLGAWPKDGALQNDAPATPADIKLILGGKFLETTETLEELKPHMGELKPDTIVTIHVIVRPTLATKSSSGKLGDKEENVGCACCIM